MELTKQEAGNFLSSATGDKCFCGNDGQTLCSLEDLAGYLENMSPVTFSYHVTASNNDFCNWVREVVHDYELADKMSADIGQAEMAKTVKDRIKVLKKRAA